MSFWIDTPTVLLRGYLRGVKKLSPFKDGLHSRASARLEKFTKTTGIGSVPGAAAEILTAGLAGGLMTGAVRGTQWAVRGARGARAVQRVERGIEIVKGSKAAMRTIKAVKPFVKVDAQSATGAVTTLRNGGTMHEAFGHFLSLKGKVAAATVGRASGVVARVTGNARDARAADPNRAPSRMDAFLDKATLHASRLSDHSTAVAGDVPVPEGVPAAEWINRAGDLVRNFRRARGATPPAQPTGTTRPTARPSARRPSASRSAPGLRATRSRALRGTSSSRTPAASASR